MIAIPVAISAIQSVTFANMKVQRGEKMGTGPYGADRKIISGKKFILKFFLGV